MDTMRSDAWSNKEDLVLAQIVLSHIKEGSTQLKAFEECGEQIERTPAACGFRWNSTVRKKYEDAIKSAKKYRQAQKIGSKTEQTSENGNEINEESIVGLLEKLNQRMNTGQNQLKKLKRAIDNANKEHSALLIERERLLANARHERVIVPEANEDYHALVTILRQVDRMIMKTENEANHERIG